MSCEESHQMVEQFEIAFANGTADLFSIFYRCSVCRKGLVQDYMRTTSYLLSEKEADRFEIEHEPNKYKPMTRIYNEDKDTGEPTFSKESD